MTESQREGDDSAAHVFSVRLVALPEQRGRTQQALDDDIGVHVTRLRHFEAGTSQPTADVKRMLAAALQLSAYRLPSEKKQRGLAEDFRLRLEAVTQFDPEEKAVVKSVLEGLLIKNAAKRLVTTP